jgi:hypothetical protein
VARLPLRREHNAPSFDVNVEGIASLNSELTTKSAGKNDLPFGGDPGLHGKTILLRLAALPRVSNREPQPQPESEWQGRIPQRRHPFVAREIVYLGVNRKPAEQLIAPAHIKLRIAEV